MDHPKVSIYVSLDTSERMAGSKIQQVFYSLEEIVSNAPLYARFIIRAFNTKVCTLVSKKKKYLDLVRLRKEMLCGVGNMTALYDAWGQTTEEIPFSGNTLAISIPNRQVKLLQLIII